MVNGTPSSTLLAMLNERSGKAPTLQREIFVQECAESSDAPSQLAEAAMSIGSSKNSFVTVVSANCYYGQCTDPITKAKSIDPAQTFKAIESLFAAGADVVCMQEMIGEQLPADQGKDVYPFDFFPKAAFATWPGEAEKFAGNADITYLYAPAKNSAMYRQSFGNAIAINKRTMNVIQFHEQPCLTEPTESEAGEGRSAIAVLVEPVLGGGQLVVCCTHLTEQQIGETGQKQCEMIDAILTGVLAEAPFINQPTVICGDMHINNVVDLPLACAEFCYASPFLHPHGDHDPYARLAAAGFKSGQSFAKNTGVVLNTCWNAACVDYIGSRGGAQPLMYGVLDPTCDGKVLSDHRWPVGMYKTATL